MLRHHTIWGLCLSLVLAACSPARFVDPTQKPVDPSSSNGTRGGEYEPGTTPPPVVKERTTDRFIWKRPSGELNLAIVLQLHDRHEATVFNRLKEIAKGIQFSDLGQDKDYMSKLSVVRFTVLAEKESILKNASVSWSTFSPRTQSAGEFRKMMSDRLDSARESLRALRNESYAVSPFSSLDQVAKSAITDISQGPSALHMVYMSDRDNFMDEIGTKDSRDILTKTLTRAPWGKAFSSVSLFTFQDRTSENCRPNPSEFGENLTLAFSPLTSASSELCTISKADIQTALKAYSAAQGRLLLSRAPVLSTLEITANGRKLSDLGFRYNSNDNEVYLSTTEGVRAGDSIEVSYEPVP